VAAAPTASTAPVARLRGGSLRGLNRWNATLGALDLAKGYNVFALNMALQYRRVARWRDYVYGARVYMLGLTAKSALAWQVFARTLRPV
jgi:hypothetical protein